MSGKDMGYHNSRSAKQHIVLDIAHFFRFSYHLYAMEFELMYRPQSLSKYLSRLKKEAKAL